MARPREKEADPELDLVPIMNMVTILIPFLLMSVQFLSLAVIDSALPAISKQSAPAEEKDEEKLSLSVAISRNGYTILGAEGVLGNVKEDGATIPCNPQPCGSLESYDIKKLREMLHQIKDRYPKEENVILVPDSSTEYEVLVATMDATRNDPDRLKDKKPRDLFPFVVIAGNAQ